MSARKQFLFLGILSAVALVAAAFTVHFGANRLSKARAEWADANKSYAQADELLLRARTKERLSNAAGILLAKSLAMHLDPDQWFEQKVSLSQVSLPRDKVDSFLRETALTPQQVFDTDDFDISVTGPDDGLFDKPENPATQELRLTLRGTVLTRIEGSR